MRSGAWPLALCGLMVMGCDSEGSSLPSYQGNARVTAMVGSEGAELALQSGARVRIPEGALEEPVEITVEELDAPDTARLPPADANVELEQPLSLTPHGTQFRRTVEVEVPLPRARDGSELADNVEPGQLRGLRLPDETGEWEEVDVAEVRDRRAVLRTDEFSFYAVVLPPSSVPTTDADGGSGTATTGGSTPDPTTDGSVSLDAGPRGEGGSAGQPFSFQGQENHVWFVATPSAGGSFDSTPQLGAELMAGCTDSGSFLVFGLAGSVSPWFDLGVGVPYGLILNITNWSSVIPVDTAFPATFGFQDPLGVSVMLVDQEMMPLCTASAGDGVLTVEGWDSATGARGGTLDGDLIWQDDCAELNGVTRVSFWVESCGDAL